MKKIKTKTNHEKMKKKDKKIIKTIQFAKKTEIKKIYLPKTPKTRQNQDKKTKQKTRNKKKNKTNDKGQMY